MRKTILSIFILFCAHNLPAQVSAKYSQLSREAKESLDKKEFRKSAFLYREAFKANSWKALCDDRYHSALANAASGYNDSAFFQLFQLAENCSYSDYETLLQEPGFLALHHEKQWTELIRKVQKNIGKTENKLNKSLLILLDSVYRSDQTGRLNAVSVKNQFGDESNQAKEIWKKIRQLDSVNVSVVTNVIDTYGWLGKEVAGPIGNAAFGLVLQRADVSIQEKYLPLARDAFQKNNIDAYDLAVLEDLVGLRRRGKQIYGTQVKTVDEKKHYVLPVEDPETINDRRLKLGLNTMNDYLKNWGMGWDINNYKRDLMILEERKIQY